jgi:hypothetical protein
VGDADREWVAGQVEREWGGRMIVSRGKVYYPHRLSGFVALEGGEKVGLTTYNLDGYECELVTIQSLRGGSGSGICSAGSGWV